MTTWEKPRADGYFYIPGISQGITVKAMNITISNKTEQCTREIISVTSTFVINFFEIRTILGIALNYAKRSLIGFFFNRLNINFLTPFQTQRINVIEKMNWTGV